MVAADGSYLIREFLTAALGSTPGLDLAAVCVDGNELEAALTAAQPDVVVTGLRRPRLGGDEGMRVAMSFRKANPTIGVVVLGQYAEPASALGLFETGTGRRAYLLTERIRDKQELLQAIKTVAKGGSVIDPVVFDVFIQARSRAARSRLTRLTVREREVVAEIAAGKSNAAIAASLVLTKRAVEKHVNAILPSSIYPKRETSTAGSRRP